MAMKLPVALACLLFACMTTSFPYVVHARESAALVRVPPSELRTGVRYYMVPNNLRIHGIAPRITLRCPYGIGEATPDQVPVTFSIPTGQTGIIPLGSDVYISFNLTLPDNISSTWGYASRPNVLLICLGPSSEGIVPAVFKILSDGTVYSYRIVGEEPVEILNIMSSIDAWSRGFLLSLSNAANPATFTFYKAPSINHQGIKSVA